jgi:competence protein ComEC
LRSVLFVGAIAAVVIVHGAVQWSRLDDVPTGPIDDVVRIVDDPRSVRGGVVLVVAHDSWRYRLVVRSGVRGAVVAGRTGDHVRVVGERRALKTLRGRDIADHVAGEIVPRDVVPLEVASAPVYRMVSRIHTVIADVTSRLPDTDAALLRGLLIGDDRDHPDELVRAFRAAGMGHLVAVSGQNVALVLAWVAPLIAGRRRSMRVAAIVLVVALFAFVTRLEPSVVRAAVMVIIVRGAAAYGRDIGAARALFATVAVLLVVDPFLVRSVGFVLSVAATAGLVFLGPGLEGILGTGAVARIASATVAAQLAVAPFALWWFGSLPIVAVPANVVAVPIASGVMVVGLPLVLACGALDGFASFVAAMLGPGSAHVVSTIVDGVVDAALVPVRIGVRAIWWVAVVAERASPSPGLNVLAWVAAYGACVVSIARRRRMRADRAPGPAAAGSAV